MQINAYLPEKELKGIREFIADAVGDGEPVEISDEAIERAITAWITAVVESRLEEAAWFLNHSSDDELKAFKDAVRAELA